MLGLLFHANFKRYFALCLIRFERLSVESVSVISRVFIKFFLVAPFRERYFLRYTSGDAPLHSIWLLRWFHRRLVGIVGTLCGRRDLSAFAKGARNDYHNLFALAGT